MSKSRRHFSAEQKAEIVRRHVSGKEPVSKLADEFEVQPSQIHLWVKQVLEAAERAFERSPGQRKHEGAKDRRIEQLEAKLVQKNEVISELMEENVRAKKANGEL
jgi:transposase